MDLCVEETPSLELSTDPQQGLNPQECIVQDLVRQGWSVAHDFFGATLIANLRRELLDLREQDALQEAGIGRDQAHQFNARIRRDKTHWLDGSTAVQRDYLAVMEQLRMTINRELFLGLFDLEAHYALYEPGAFYRKHVDAFRGRSNRVVSVVSYLNPNWQPEDGGYLNLFGETGESSIAQVPPQAGTLVCFLSEQVPHEVTVTQQARASIAGWFRRNNSLNGLVDPPA
jgi:SM-20-related protein